VFEALFEVPAGFPAHGAVKRCHLENEIDAETACQGESDNVKLTYTMKDLFNM